MNIEEFYQWEKTSRDTIDVKRCYIDLAGDLVSGILLSQIIYWFLPGKEGSKLRVERDGYKWLAKARTEWWDECRITRHQYIRSIKILSDKGLVSTARYKFAGRPVAHIRLNLSALLEGLQSTVHKADNPISTKADNPIYRKRTIQSTESGQSFTETTSETTSETTKPENKKAEPSPVDIIFKAIHAFYGYPDKIKTDPIPNYGKEGKAIKKMIDRGFSLEQIMMLWQEKVKKRGAYCSMVWVNEDIAGSPDPIAVSSTEANFNYFYTTHCRRFAKEMGRDPTSGEMAEISAGIREKIAAGWSMSEIRESEPSVSIEG